MLTVFFGRVIILRYQENRACLLGGQLNRYGMVICWHVCLTRKRAKMAVLEHTLRLQLQNHALVLIWLSFPLSFPNNWTPFFPIRDGVRAEHVLLDHFGIHERIPYFGNGSTDGNVCFSDQCVFHVFSNSFLQLQLFSEDLRGLLKEP